MAERPSQLPLEFPIRPRFGVEDFLVSACNEHAYAVIEAWPQWNDPVLLLSGPAGSGKSHLAAIWARNAHATTQKARDLTLQQVPELVAAGAVLIEDVDRGPIDEPALFHLLNGARERRAFVLVTAQHETQAWGLRTPDLVSRLRLAPSVEIGPPDDALLRAVLVKLFLDRQLVVDTSIVELIARRAERSIAAARAIVAALDHEALSSGRRIGRTLVLSVLERLERNDPAL